MTTESNGLLKCTIKKSISVAKKVALIVGGIVLCVALIYAICLIISTAHDDILSGFSKISDFASVLYGYVSLIPWWVYAGVVAILVILVYSFMWCVFREVTEDDWSGGTSSITVIIPVIISILSGAFCGFVIGIWCDADAFAYPMIIGVAAVFLLFSFLLPERSFTFIGAYLHYRNRIRTESILQKAREYPNEQ
jgi:hypothetical protein